MSIVRNRIFAAAVGVFTLGAATFTGAPATQAAVGDDVRLNEIQVIGSHNSYKVLPSQAEQDLIRSFIGSGADQMQYEHAPLGEQFASQKVRQIELDVWVDSAGGRFTQPLLRSVLNLGPYQPELMNQPGTKTFHIQDVDYGTTCPTFVMCLQQVKAWSDSNPGHVPLSILVELKDTPLELGDFDFTDPEPWTPAAMDVLDTEIRSVFSEGRTITPDDIRGDAATLRDAVTTTGWPTLGESRGKVMFVMDNGGGYRTSYLAGHPSLAGRVLFTNSTAGADDAAFIKMNNPFDASIPGLVSAGFLVRTRADGDTTEARSGDTSMRDAALASGAQWVSTDYPVPGMAVGFTSSYVAAIPGGTVARCNPVNGPAGCVDADLDLVGRSPQQPPVTRPPVTTPGSPTTGSTIPGTTVPGSTVPGTPTTGSTVPNTATTRPGAAPRPGSRPSARPAPAATPVRTTASYAG
jgi:hypothetical protein